ncbi:MAG: thioesterase domain-containing protein, partial [Planctomycetota bacterium]
VGMAKELAEKFQQESEPTGERQRMVHAWFDERILDGRRAQHYRGKLDALQDWVLEEHRLQDGKAVLPGTAYLDMAAAALRDCSGHDRVKLRDVQFLAPCEVPDDAPRELEVQLHRDGKDYTFQVRSRDVEGKESWLQHASGKGSIRAMPALQNRDLEELRAKAERRRQEVHSGSLPDPQDQYLRFGPRFKSHQAIGYGADYAYARLRLPEAYAAELQDYPLHPALLDIATGCAMDLVPGYDPDDAMFVPLGYASLVQHDALTADLHARLSLQASPSGSGDVVRFDVDLYDNDGNLLVAVEGLELRRLDLGFASAAQASGQVNLHETPSEQAFLDILEAGIDASSGMDALDRVLSGQLPPVLTVSSIDLGRLAAIQEKAMAELGSGPAVKFERPQLSSTYAPPTDAIDKQLVNWWEELLGVEQVGIDDDFFEVGGHSLVAVRLFARIKKKWNLEYPLSLLFEAPTIRLCAEMLRSGLALESEEGDQADDTRTALGLGSRYLVPLNDVRKSDRRPFFLVAGMFGNVLNLRHLATHLGADQPMYAIQARGLHGDDRPHRRFEDMARDYLEEIRRIQPQGPYLLGGFSGGGITAFEMAQQLHAEGEKTEALVLLDTPVTKIETAGAIERFLIQCMRMRRGGFGYLLEWPKKRIAWELEKRRDMGDAVERGLAPAEFRSEMIQEGFVEALEHYQLRPYSGRLTLFRPPLDTTFKLPRGRFANQYREIQDSNNFWDPFASGGIDTFEVPGDHDSMVLEPHVRVLGAKVSEVLEAAQDRIEQDEA